MQYISLHTILVTIMPDFNEETVKTLTRLTRIEVTTEEIPELFANLKRILDYFDQLQEVDLSQLPPYSHVEEQGIESLRDDVCETTLSREEFLSNAPDHVGGMIRVPPVLKSNNS